MKTHMAHLRLRPQDCSMNNIAKLVKEYLNMDEDLVVIASRGFEIMDDEAIRGKSTMILQSLQNPKPQLGNRETQLSRRLEA